MGVYGTCLFYVCSSDYVGMFVVQRALLKVVFLS